MSDEGERTCPLCAEEMDLTDQQLKPCKCGYEICVWCWHHLMDMAEKDDTEGRCPACRSAYDREKIVGMASNCERLVAEVNMEKKIKSQKAKVKSSEGRKQLGSVRVIQRNLVYIVGLPLNVADEDLLQRREYFGQYGKVLKVSMSRTATGLIQQFPNNTCSVYITYSKEEEAIRCIQNVHQFVLEGKSLRACFGTTKYCHAWLRNVPCTNPDCLYLHEIGSQEDSFTKDEIISAYTRSRVQQITGTSNNLQRRSGNMLPPPVDDCCNYSSASIGKPIVKNASNSAGSIVRGSPPNGSTSKSVALPAAASWGTRGSSCLPPAIACSTINAPAKLKADTVSNTVAFSGASAASTFHAETGKKPVNNESQTTITKIKSDTLKAVTSLISKYGSYPSERLDEPEGPTSETLSCQLSSLQDLKNHHKDIGISPSTTVDFIGKSQERNIIPDVHINKLCSDISSMGTDGDVEGENADLMSLKTSVSDKDLSKAPENHLGFQEYITEQFREPLLSTHALNGVSLINGDVSRDECDWTSKILKGVSKTSKIEEDVESFSSQRCNDPEVASQSNYLPALSASLNGSNQLASRYSCTNEAYRSSKTSKIEEDVESFSSQRRDDPEVASQSNYLPALNVSLNGSNQVGSRYSGTSEAYRSSIGVKVDNLSLDKKFNDSSLLSSNIPVTANVYSESFLSSSAGSDNSFVQSFVLPNEGRRHIARHTGNVSGSCGNYSDKGESSIISNILSMDCDVWNDSLASPQNLAKLLGETEKQSISASPWRVQNNSQSRFSFARQEESRIQDLTHSPLNVIGQLQKGHSFGLGIAENDHVYADKFRLNNGSYSTNYDGSENLSGNPITNSFNNFSAPPRAQISAPPGFSVPNKAPPPGFSSHERLNHVSDSMAGNHLHDSSSLLRNIYQASQAGNNVNTSDLEFMDPAILAVGKGRIQLGLNNPGLDMRSNFTSQYSAFESDPRVQILMQRSLSPQQNLRFSDVMDGFNHVTDSYGLSSRPVDQSQVKNLSQFSQMSIQHPRSGVMSNSHWDSWSDAQNGNNMGMADLLRNDRVGFNKFYSGYEDSKFRMPSSGDLYNRTFGM